MSPGCVSAAMTAFHRTLSPQLGFEGSYRRRPRAMMNLSRGVQKFGRELLVGGPPRGRARVDDELLEALREGRGSPAPLMNVYRPSRPRRALPAFLGAGRVNWEFGSPHLEELDHFLVLLDGRDDLVRAQRAAAVLVDQLEAAPGRREELARELRDLLLGPFRVGLALGRALLELVLERDLDALLPARNVDR